MHRDASLAIPRGNRSLSIKVYEKAIEWAETQCTEASKTDLKSAEVRRRKLAPNYLYLRKNPYRGSFNTLMFGEYKPLIGSCHDGRLDLIYHRDPGLKEGHLFPLWTIQ